MMNQNLSQPSGRKGFALVVTISMLVLLSLVAVAVLTLSRNQLRSQGIASLRSEARANAKMALMIAIGELQKHAGRDQAVTASSDIIAGITNRDWAGVWKTADFDPTSFATTSPDPEGIAATESIRTELVGTNKSARAEWLVSGLNPQPGATVPDAEMIAKVADNVGVLRDVFVSKVNIANDNNEGGIAYWVSDENVKADLHTSPDAYATLDPSEDLYEGIRVLQHPTRSAIEAAAPFFGATTPLSSDIQNVFSPGDFQQYVNNKGLNWPNTMVKDPIVGTPHLGDYAFGATSVICDTRRGGLKLDLTAAFEDLSQYELFISDVAPSRDSRLIFAGTDTISGTKVGGPRWDQFYSYYQLYRPFQELVLNEDATVTDENFENRNKTNRGSSTLSRNRLRALTVRNGPTFLKEAKTPTKFSHETVAEHLGFREYWNDDSKSKHDNALSVVSPLLIGLNAQIGLRAEDKGAGEYQFYVTFSPTLIFWNPYNVELTQVKPNQETNLLSIESKKIIGRVGGKEGQNLSSVLGELGTTHFSAKEAFSMAPGEVKLLGISANSTLGSSGAPTIAVGEDYDELKYIQIELSSLTGLKAADSVNLQIANEGDGIVQNAYHLSLFHKNGGGGAPSSWSIGGVDGNTLRSHSGSVATEPIQLDAIAASSKKTPKFFANLGELDQPKNFLYIKSEMRSTKAQKIFRSGGKPANYPVRLPLYSDYSIIRNVPQGNVDTQVSIIYSFTDSTDHKLAFVKSDAGFLSYFGSSTGVEGKTHVAVKDIPRLPLLSVAEYMNMNFGMTAFTPFHPVGGGYKSSFVPQDEVVGEARFFLDGKYAKPQIISRVDVNYLLNETLFDKYFFSGVPSQWRETSFSLGNLPAGYGDPSMLDSKGNRRLRAENFRPENTFYPYRAIGSERASNEDLMNDRMKVSNSNHLDNEKLLKSLRGYKTAASSLNIQGGFNINSTSVAAWKSLLACHAGRNVRSWDLASNSEEIIPPVDDVYPLPRYQMPTKAERAAPMNSAWSSLRGLDEEELDTLCQNIVNEVRLRGPFLSLSDFVNRRVGDDRDLSDRGTLQAAIDNTAINGDLAAEGVEPRQILNPNKEEDDDPDIATSVVSPSTATGIPGYLIQNDILRNITSVITPRSDTFVVRGLGEATDGTLTIKAVCEAKVIRSNAYIGNVNSELSIPDLISEASAESNISIVFGRRFNIVSFKWIS